VIGLFLCPCSEILKYCMLSHFKEERGKAVLLASASSGGKEVIYN